MTIVALVWNNRHKPKKGSEMRILLFLMSVVAALVGFGLFASAKSAMHETTATAFLIVAAVLFIGAGIIDTLLAIERRLKKATEDPSEPKTE